jgi:hypothetical protein
LTLIVAFSFDYFVILITPFSSAADASSLLPSLLHYFRCRFHSSLIAAIFDAEVFALFFAAMVYAADVLPSPAPLLRRMLFDAAAAVSPPRQRRRAAISHAAIFRRLSFQRYFCR